MKNFLKILLSALFIFFIVTFFIVDKKDGQLDDKGQGQTQTEQKDSKQDEPKENEPKEEPNEETSKKGESFVRNITGISINEKKKKVIIEYMDLYYRSIKDLKVYDMSSLFANENARKKNEAAISLLIETRKLKKNDLHLTEAYYDLNFTSDDGVVKVLEDSYIKKLELLEEGLEFEKDRLEEEKYFEKDNIGHFYGIFETRPYMRGLYTKANIFIEMGKIKQARDICKEILKLNKNDNLGARYLLMAIYAFLEDEKEMLALYKKYPEEHLQMLFPLFALYYKNSNDEKAIEYLKRINKSNPNFIKLFKGKMEDNENIMPGYYSIGDSSEIKMYFMNYTFLLLTLPLIDEYILKYSKK